ncbi:MAG: hypothetical protein V3T81_07985 [Thermoanaerobaculia bacterium]
MQGRRPLQRLLDRDRTPGDPLGQGVALDQLQDEEGLPVGLLQAVDRGDVGMVQGGQELGFPLEASQSLGVLRQPLRQGLDRHLPVEPRVPGPVDHAHPPCPDLLEDLVVGDRAPVHNPVLASP